MTTPSTLPFETLAPDRGAYHVRVVWPDGTTTDYETAGPLSIHEMAERLMAVVVELQAAAAATSDLAETSS